MLIPIDGTTELPRYLWRVAEPWMTKAEQHVNFLKRPTKANASGKTPAERKRTIRSKEDVHERRDSDAARKRRERLIGQEERALLRTQRPFVVWDGEGCNDTDGTMSYVLFGYNGTSPRGEFITGRRLSTLECFTFIWDAHKELGTDYVHVAFGFSFDVDQICRDIPTDKLQELKDTNELTWEGWKLKYIPRKFFTIQRGNRRGLTIYDVISFFHSNLIGAAREYCPDDERIPVVARGKSERDSFNYSELQSLIIPYWRLEGKLMISVMNALRSSLLGAGINLDKWHGPGAIAEALIVRENLAGHIQRSRAEMPDEVTDATAFAYFGGRFENFIMGSIEGPIYAYDIRSAYPAALAQCPMLVNGKWVQTRELDDWGLYKARVTYQAEWVINNPEVAMLIIGAVPTREEDGRVNFPTFARGWYYGHELIAARLCGFDVDVEDGWIYEQRDNEGSAFDFLADMYRQRAAYKRSGNPAQLACKLGINSVYGKLAQLTGWDEDNYLPPKYHHQWYAGHTTSWTRARLMLAMSQAPGDIIACETDGIYSRVPLDVKIGTELGEWELETYDEMLYVQSGVYFARNGDSWTKARTRGLSVGNVTIDDALSALPDLESISGVSRRYGAMSGYLGRDRHWQWFDEERAFQWGGGGKRWHDPELCGCEPGTLTHRTFKPFQYAFGPAFSSPRKLPWLTAESENWVVDDDAELEALNLV